METKTDAAAGAAPSGAAPALVNLTPHVVRLAGPDGGITEIPPSGTVARVSSRPGDEITEGPRAALPVPCFGAPKFGEVEGLPAPVPGTIYIVSGIVAGRCPGRPDVVAPGTGPADGPIRRDGRIWAVTRLVAAPE